MRRGSMISEIDLLKEDLPRLKMRFGVDDPFVEVLKAQLASLQNQTEHQRKNEQYRWGVVNFIRSQIWKINKSSDNRL
jgi:hypothetical protein